MSTPEATPRGPAELKPFPVDPEVMAAIRPTQPRDVSRLAALHRAAMGSSLWAQLGTPFLMALYTALLEQPTFISFVYEEGGRVRGFIAGTEDAGQMFRGVLKQHGQTLLLPTVRGVMQTPELLRPLLSTPRYFTRTRPQTDTARASGHGLHPPDIKAESLFCSFEPDLRGKRISGHINKVLFDELRARGHAHVKISTDKDNEGAVRQLLSWGFEQVSTFEFYGKPMRLFVLDLLQSPRVEPISRHPQPRR